MKRKGTNRLFTLILALGMIVSMFAGCGDSTASEPSASEPSAGEPSTVVPSAVDAADEPVISEAVNPEDAESTVEPAAAVTYPIDEEGVVLTYGYFYDTSYPYECEDMEIWGQLEAATGIALDVTCFSAMEYGDSLALLFASRDLPDLYKNAGFNISQGLDYGIEQGLVIPLDEYWEYLPDFYAALTADSRIYDSVVTSEGHIGEANGIYISEYGPQNGFVIRKDWLDELNMDLPVTYDDWTETLTAFKNNYDCTSPLWLSEAGSYVGSLLGAGFGVGSCTKTNDPPFYQIDGQIVYGPLQDGFRDYLELLAGWYADGLIDPDFTSNGDNMFPTDLPGAANGTYGIWTTMLQMFDQYARLSADEDFEIVALPDAVQNEGDVNHLGFDTIFVNNGSVAISGNCENIEAACKWVNYGYTEEGILLYNYGVEGESYTVTADGPEFTDLVVSNPDGLTFQQAWFKYAGGDNGPTVIDYTCSFFAFSENAANATSVWSSVSDGAWELPENFALNSAETEQLAYYYTDLETCVNTEVLLFITGQEALDDESWESFKSQLESMNAMACVDLYQDALDRALAD